MLNVAEEVLQKLNEDRRVHRCLCDFVIRTSNEDFPVHKSVIAATSAVFRNLFMLDVNKNCKWFKFPRSITPCYVHIIIEYIYGEEVKLNHKDAKELLKAAICLKIELLQKFCVNYLLDSLKHDNVIGVWKIARHYNIQEVLEECEQFLAADDLQSWMRDNLYLDFEFSLLKRFIQLKEDSNSHESLYNCIVNWINFDWRKRRIHFKELYDIVDVSKLSSSFFRFVVLADAFCSKLELEEDKKDKLMKKYDVGYSKQVKSRRKSEMIISGLQKKTWRQSSANPGKRTKLHSQLRECLKETDHTSIFLQPSLNRNKLSSQSNSSSVRVMSEADEFIVIGGETSPSSIKIFNVLSHNWTIFRKFENRICIDARLAFVQKELYIIGGRNSDYSEVFNEVHCLDMTKCNQQLKAAANMNEKRYKFGCTVFDHKIYVAGGINNENECLEKVECYSIGKNEWEEKPSMTKKRGGCCLLGRSGAMLAIGGQQNSHFYHRSVEVFSGINWRMSTAMGTKRSQFAAVLLQDLYAIGGKSGEMTFCNSVERRDDIGWKYVAKLNVPRAGHCACAMKSKIYVVGGQNSNGPVCSMEVYDSTKNIWEILGDIVGDPIGASMALVNNSQTIDQ